MKRKLKPVIGILVTGLVGVAQATCYYENSFVCLAANTDFGYYAHGDCVDQLYSATDWYGWTLIPTESNAYNPGTTVYCAGSAYYTDCVDGKKHFIMTNDGIAAHHYTRAGTSCIN